MAITCNAIDTVDTSQAWLHIRIVRARSTISLANNATTTTNGNAIRNAADANTQRQCIIVWSDYACEYDYDHGVGDGDGGS